MIEKNLSSYFNLISQYTELRVQENRTMDITFLKGNLVQNSKNISSGVSARAFKNGSWGFASSPEMDSENIKNVIKYADNNADFLDLRENKNMKQFTPVVANSEIDFRTKNLNCPKLELWTLLKKLMLIF